MVVVVTSINTMGNKCGTELKYSTCSNTASVCMNYIINENPWPGSVEEKMNYLVGTFCGMKTGQDIINSVMLNGPLNGGGIFPLIFPPLIENIPCLNDNVLDNRTSNVLSPSDYTLIPNPYLLQAQTIQGIMFGTERMGSFPCAQFFYVPYSYDINFNLIWKAIQNPAYSGCINAMYTALKSPQPVGTTEKCVDGIGLMMATSYYSADYLADLTIYEVLQILTPSQGGTGNATQCQSILFQPGNIGPYDINTGNPCTNIKDPGCTYAICMSEPNPGGYNCQPNGQCVPVSAGGTFGTMDACIECQKNESCPGNNICCPESQTYGGVCPTSAPITPSYPSYEKDAIIGISIAIAALVLVIFSTWYIKKRFISK